MKTLYIVRHGETLLNLLNRSQGWADSPLTQKGTDQAIDLGNRFRKAGIHFDSAFCSDTGRARQTVQQILMSSNNTTARVQENIHLREASFGRFEGADNDEMWAQGGAAVGETGMSRKSSIGRKIKALSGIKRLDTIHYAEDYTDVQKRIKSFQETLCHTHASNILIVTHSLYICCLVYTLIDDQQVIDKVPNCSVTKLTLENNKFQLGYIGRTNQF
ncbi:histidine phosphatase family protein [Sporolactobacillus terrae]|uniref:histidine phosphatase family protein n=1 Tax=Sporolactobacillus terrae TaxID=269673 RepID=UPI0011191DC8|nr:histidine phosphatase family protein [Sporolactobacillus terrae]